MTEDIRIVRLLRLAQSNEKKAVAVAKTEPVRSASLWRRSLGQRERAEILRRYIASLDSVITPEVEVTDPFAARPSAIAKQIEAGNLEPFDEWVRRMAKERGLGKKASDELIRLARRRRG